MNDLLSQLESQFGREDTYAYADDLSEIVTDEGSALSCIHTVKHWAQENGLELNMKKGKSAFMRLVLRPSPRDDLYEEIGGLMRDK